VIVTVSEVITKAISCALDDFLTEKLSFLMELINASRHYTRF